MAHTRSSLERYALQLGDRGRLVLPSSVRKRLGLEPGDRLVLTLEPGGEMRLVSLRAQVQRLQGVFKDVPGSLADELVAERREEARREETE